MKEQAHDSVLAEAMESCGLPLSHHRPMRQALIQSGWYIVIELMSMSTK